MSLIYIAVEYVQEVFMNFQSPTLLQILCIFNLQENWINTMLLKSTVFFPHINIFLLFLFCFIY